MKSFLKELNNQDRTFYQKVYLVTGVNHDTKTISDKQLDKTAQELTNKETFDLCRFNTREAYSNSVKNVIQSFRENGTENTCLHVAGQYGNMSMLNYILKNKVIDSNLRNTYGDTTLMHTLRNSSSNTFQKSILLLSKYSDLSLVDAKEKRPDQITLSSYSKSRARIIQILREQYIARSKKQ